MYWFDRKLFTLYVKQFNSIRKAKETRLGHVTDIILLKEQRRTLKNYMKSKGLGDTIEKITKATRH